jgi:hypothetical protein
MLLGNHCTYYKNTNRINSPELLLEQYSNISIYASPKHLTLGSKKFLMLPWINTENRDEVLKLLLKPLMLIFVVVIWNLMDLKLHLA